MTHVDAIVVGSGPNGLVGANRLADAGWSVLVLEQQPRPGGAVRHDQEVHQGFTHDTFSAFYPLAAASPAMLAMDLERWGVRWCHAPAVLGHPFADGSWALQLRDREKTAFLFEQAQPGDGEAWLRLCALWDEVGEHLIGSLLSPFPPLRHGAGFAASLPKAGGVDLLRMLLTPAADLWRGRFRGAAPSTLLAGNAGHSDIPLESPGSGAMGLLMTMLGQTVGFPVPEGGAGQLTAALVRRLEAGGGTLVCDAEVTRIEVDRGRVRGVRTADGQRFAADVVLADVSAPALYERLLDDAAVPARTRRRMRTFQWDPGTVKVDWALSGPVPWASPPLYAPGTVHIADSVSQMSEALSQVHAGFVPAQPFLLAGLMSTADPSRSPAGTETMWAYTHVPQRARGDAGGTVRGTWDHDDCEQFADRMQARIEALAPGFESKVLSRRVLGPKELEARNANLVGGAVGGGTQQLHQELIFRPVAGTGRADTAVRGLYLASSSAHPGGGVHGAAGNNAARAALFRSRLARVLRR